MTATESPDGPSRHFARLAHYPLPVAIVLVVLDIPNVHGALAYVLGVPLIIVFLIFSYAQMQHHRARLCDKCGEDAPLDPQTAVVKKMRWLKLTHRIMDTRLCWLPLGLIAVLAAISYVNIHGIRLSWVSSLVWLLAFGPAALLQVHTPLEPWCPWCRWGGGEGPEEPSPEPTPDPSDAPERDTVIS